MLKNKLLPILKSRNLNIFIVVNSKAVTILQIKGCVDYLVIERSHISGNFLYAILFEVIERALLLPITEMVELSNRIIPSLYNIDTYNF